MKNVPRSRVAAPRRGLSSLLAGGAVLVGTSWLGACTPEVEAQPETCGEIIDEAAAQTEIDDQIAWLDTAIESCRDYGEITTAMESKVQLVGYSVEKFLTLRCTKEETLNTTEVCLTAAPPTTIAEIETNPVHIGTTLDGRQIEVTPDDVEFVGDQPKQIYDTVQLAQAGAPAACVPVLEVRDNYAKFIQPDLVGDHDQDILSMYANHAQSVADFLGCVSYPMPGPDPEVGAGGTTPPTTTEG